MHICMDVYLKKKYFNIKIYYMFSFNKYKKKIQVNMYVLY